MHAVTRYDASHIGCKWEQDCLYAIFILDIVHRKKVLWISPCTCKYQFPQRRKHVPCLLWSLIAYHQAKPVSRLQNAHATSHRSLVTPQHALHEITQRTPEVLASVRQSVLINEKYIVFEARVKVGFKA